MPRVSRVPAVVLLGAVTKESICHQLQPFSEARNTAPQVTFSQSFSAAEISLEGFAVALAAAVDLAAGVAAIAFELKSEIEISVKINFFTA